MNIGIIGFGALGEKLSLFLSNSNTVICSDSNQKKKNYPTNVIHYPSNISVAKNSKIILLCVKPKQIQSVCQDISSVLDSDSIVISCAAAVPLAKLESWLPKCTIIRCMPNVPCCIGKGTVVYYSNSEKQHDIMKSLFTPNDVISVSTDTSVDAATVLSGCAPAFWAWFYKALQNSLVSEITPRLTQDLLLQSMLGTNKMLEIMTSDEIIKSVASPGGATEKALKSMQSDSIEHALQDAFQRLLDIQKEL